MTKKKFYLTILIFLSFTLNAQKKHNQDIESIKKMRGCFEISFNFSETFNYVEDQKYFTEDLQFELNSESVKGKFEGKGYIRYIKMMPQ